MATSSSKMIYPNTLRALVIGMAMFAVNAIASDIVAPPEVSSAAPAGTHLAFYKASAVDAVAVYETASDASGSRKRDFIVFRKKDGVFQPVVRNDKIIACSTCTPERDDPFLGGRHIDVSPGHIHVEQIYGDAHPSSATYDFTYDTASGQWKVNSASRTDGTAEGKDATKKLPLPASGLLKDFDGRWSTTSYWNALVVNDTKHSFQFLLSSPSEEALAATIKKSCDEKGNCRVIARVQDGCLALARDAGGQFFAAATPGTGSEDKASQEAMATCKSKGKGECEAVRTSCSAGAI